jgi:hypothetical protein
LIGALLFLKAIQELMSLFLQKGVMRSRLIELLEKIIYWQKEAATGIAMRFTRVARFDTSVLKPRPK